MGDTDGEEESDLGAVCWVEIEAERGRRAALFEDGSFVYLEGREVIVEPTEKWVSVVVRLRRGLGGE